MSSDAHHSPLEGVEFSVQTTRQTVYLLLRGVNAPIAEPEARTTAERLSSELDLGIERFGPSTFPGPDGKQYEWFFRVRSAPGVDSSNPVALGAAVEQITRNLPRNGSLSGRQAEVHLEDQFLMPPVTELTDLERSRALALFKGDVAKIRAALLERVGLIAKLRHALKRDGQRVKDGGEVSRLLLDELAARESNLIERETTLGLREQTLQAKESSLQAWKDSISAKPEAQGAAEVVPEEGFFPRLVFLGDSWDRLKFEIPTRDFYFRFLAGLNDGIDPSKHPMCLKHRKVESSPGKSWWEIRLKDIVAADHRMCYKRHAGGQIHLHIFRKKDDEKVYAKLP